jgi:HemY protein
MTRLIVYLLAVLAVAAGLSWLADRPGNLVVNWEGYEIETSVFRAVVIFAALLALAAVALSILRQIWNSPATVGHFLMRRRQRRGLDSLSSGMIAVGAGDRNSATRYAMQARKSLPNEPLTHLLRAQAAQLSGDKATARRIFEAMLGSPDTEQLGLRGLFLEATREKETEAARQFAERAVKLNPRLSWPVEALFDLQCKANDWPGALETLAVARKHGHFDKPAADRKRAVLLTAQAQALEDQNAEKALALALEAHGLAPTLIPAAAIAGRLLAARGSTPKAAKILQKTWSKAPHPDLATAYAYARIGDSPRDRLDRVKQLSALNPHSIESPIAVANAAIEAHLYDEARQALWPLLEGRLTQRVATLMARIEGEQYGDKGKVREWLARAVNAPRDPAWTADGVVSERWAAISPVTGTLDAYQWRVPVDDLQPAEGEELTTRLESLVTLGAPASVPPDQNSEIDGKLAAADEVSGAEIDADAVSDEVEILPPVKPAPSAVASKPETKSAKAHKTAPSPTTAAPPVRGAKGEAKAAAPHVIESKDAAELNPSANAAKPHATSMDAAVSQPAAGAAKMMSTDPKPAGKQTIRSKRQASEAQVEPAPVFSRPPDDPGPELEDPDIVNSPRRTG